MICVRVPMGCVISNLSMEFVCIDYLHLEQNQGVYKYMLEVVDHFTRLSEAYPTRNMSRWRMADFLFNGYIPHCAPLWQIRHDQDREFENYIFRTL